GRGGNSRADRRPLPDELFTSDARHALRFSARRRRTGHALSRSKIGALQSDAGVGGRPARPGANLAAAKAERGSHAEAEAAVGAALSRRPGAALGPGVALRRSTQRRFFAA